jgi:Na+/H+ antiporter NhaA
MLRTVYDRLAEARPVDVLLAPLRNFLRTEASGGLLLMAAALVALVWANSPFAASYAALWETPVALRLGDFGLTESLHFWINDGLMAIFPRRTPCERAQPMSRPRLGTWQGSAP